MREIPESLCVCLNIFRVHALSEQLPALCTCTSVRCARLVFMWCQNDEETNLFTRRDEETNLKIYRSAKLVKKTCGTQSAIFRENQSSFCNKSDGVYKVLAQPF